MNLLQDEIDITDDLPSPDSVLDMVSQLGSQDDPADSKKASS